MCALFYGGLLLQCVIQSNRKRKCQNIKYKSNPGYCLQLGSHIASSGTMTRIIFLSFLFLPTIPRQPNVTNSVNYA